MKNIQAQTSIWVEKELITAEQAEKLIAYEQSSASRSWINYGVMGIGIVVILTGVISLIAANWEFIPDITKMLCYFAFQGLLAFLIIKDKEKSPIIREGLILASNLLVLGGIALVSQVFNLKGEGWGAVLLWIFLTFPLMYYAKWQLTAHVWMIGSVLTGVFWTCANSMAHAGFSRFLCTAAFAFLFAAIPLLKQIKLPLHIPKPIQFWSYLYLLGLTTLFANFSWAEQSSYRFNDSYYQIQLLVFFLSAIIFSIAAIISERPKQSRWALAAMGLSLAIYAILPSIYLVPDLPLVGAVGAILVWSLAATAAAFDNQQKLFNLASALIAIRFIVVYFEVFGSLAATGVGLIITGVVILFTAYVWNKVRKSVFPLLKVK